MKRYMTMMELADHLSVSTVKVKEMVDDGGIPDNTYFKHGRTYRFNVARVEAYLLGCDDLPEGVEIQTTMDFGDEEERFNNGE